jgi:hypothetical protein
VSTRIRMDSDRFDDLGLRLTTRKSISDVDLLDFYSEADRARSEEKRSQEQLNGANAMIDTLREAERSARAEIAKKDETIKALADALEAERGLTGNGCACITAPGLEYRCVSCVSQDALRLAGRIP